MLIYTHIQITDEERADWIEKAEKKGFKNLSEYLQNLVENDGKTKPAPVNKSSIASKFRY